jgi:hypothetical protein
MNHKTLHKLKNREKIMKIIDKALMISDKVFSNCKKWIRLKTIADHSHSLSKDYPLSVYLKCIPFLINFYYKKFLKHNNTNF